MKRWYVAYTQPQAELSAAGHLKRHGFNAYLSQHLKHVATPNGGSEPAPLTMTSR